MSEKIVDARTEALIRAAGGTKLEKCKTCNECASGCFLTQFYPHMPPPEIPRALLESRVTELVDSEFIWACTLCGRCTLECPEGLDMDRIMRVVRGQGVREDKVPKRLKEGLDKIRETGNSIGVDAEEFVDTLQWLAEEAAEEIEGVDGQPEIPIDEEGAEFLYLPNPREYTSTPHMFSVYWKFFLATAADWTYASDVCD